MCLSILTWIPLDLAPWKMYQWLFSCLQKSCSKGSTVFHPLVSPHRLMRMISKSSWPLRILIKMGGYQWRCEKCIRLTGKASHYVYSLHSKQKWLNSPLWSWCQPSYFQPSGRAMRRSCRASDVCYLQRWLDGGNRAAEVLSSVFLTSLSAASWCHPCIVFEWGEEKYKVRFLVFFSIGTPCYVPGLRCAQLWLRAIASSILSIKLRSEHSLWFLTCMCLQDFSRLGCVATLIACKSVFYT